MKRSTLIRALARGRAGMTLALGFAGASGLAWAGGAVSASDAPRSPPRITHAAAVEINACMRKRMAGDPLISYNQAAKDCRKRVLNGNRTTPLVAADGKP